MHFNQPLSGHIGCFKCFNIIGNAVMNIFGHKTLSTILIILLAVFLEVGSLCKVYKLLSTIDHISL